jgi:hypothetical protein
MRKIVALTLLVAATSTASAQDAGWVEIATSSNGNDVYSVKLHSGERTQNKQGEAITVVVGKIEHKTTQTIEVDKWYVTHTDCVQGYGELVILDIEGNYQGESAFAFGSKNIGSAIAAGICAAGQSNSSRAKAGGLKS